LLVVCCSLLGWAYAVVVSFKSFQDQDGLEVGIWESAGGHATSAICLSSPVANNSYF